MADITSSKRQREETQSSVKEHVEETKRHKSYKHILSLLEAEEDEPNQDLSTLITTFQQELSSDSVLDVPFSPCQQTTTPSLKPDQENPTAVGLEDYTSATSSLKEEDDKEQVIRHLLEASDDELGIPNREDVDGDGDVVGVGVDVFELDEGFTNGENGFALCDGLWELEDEAANYYTLLQSELFM